MGVWAVDIEALDGASSPVTLRFASADYTQQDAGPVFHFYEPRLVQPALISLEVFAGDLLPVNGGAGVGSMELINSDGGLDYLADYAIDGRPMTLRRISGGVASTALTATLERLTFNDRRVVITLRNPLTLLDQVLPGNRYAGDNVLPDGVEGTADDIGGARKPLVFGSVVNATPVLVNTSKLIFQVHDGSDVTVSAVRDRGVALTFSDTATDLNDLLLNPPAAGQWRRYEGYFSLGAQGQAITCDAARTATAAGDVFDEIGGLAGYTTAAADVTALNSVGAVGAYVAQDTTYMALLNRIAHGCGAFWSLDAAGELRVQQLAAPGGVDLTIEDYQIKSLVRSGTGSGRNGLPIPKVTIKADRIETVQTDLAATASNPARYGRQFREVVAEDAAVRTRHPLAEDLVVESPLRSLADAGTVATLLLSLLKVRRDTCEASVELDASEMALLIFGITVRLNTARLGYPRNFVLLGWRPDAKRGRVTLILWG